MKEALEQAIAEAMQAAKDSPGLYGGRYVARHDDGTFCVLEDDNPDLYPDWDLWVHCQPTKAYGIGRIRNYVQEDGSVNFHC